MLGIIIKTVLSTGVGIASQLVVKDVLLKLVTVPSSAALKVAYSVGIGGIGLAVSHQVAESVEKTYDAVGEIVTDIKERTKKEKI